MSEWDWSLNMACNHLSLYMWWHIDVQADWRRSWTYGRAPKRHRHVVGFFNVPIQAPTHDQPFYGYSKKPPHFSRLLQRQWEYGGHILKVAGFIKMFYMIYRFVETIEIVYLQTSFYDTFKVMDMNYSIISCIAYIIYGLRLRLCKAWGGWVVCVFIIWKYLYTFDIWPSKSKGVHPLTMQHMCQVWSKYTP